MKIKTLIVDDNPNWQFTLSKFVQLHPSLHLVASCESAIEAYAHISEQDIDLLICDIEMPDFSGLNLVRTIQNGPLFIFVTAHSKYAVESYEVSPVDFLLKPIDYERFMRSIEKVKKRLNSPDETLAPEPYFFVRVNNQYIQLKYSEVFYIKAREHYVEIVTKESSYLTLLSITKIEERLKGDVFLRVHRSYLVHREVIRVVDTDELILTNGETVPIGEQYRTQITNKHIAPANVSRPK